ncbi:MAG TPA: arginine--tRNA ligase [Coriobacteriia bacterium]
MREHIAHLVAEALASAVADGVLTLPEVPPVELERPREASHGDYATNVAMQVAKSAKLPPRTIAEAIAERMGGDPDIAAVEVAGPGFVNIRLSAEALRTIVREAREQGSAYGASDLGRGEKLQVEFVSANPTGPMHVGHGRWAALGDSLARVLAHSGWDVRREFYINDAGVQMDIFAKSVAARYLELAGREAEFGENWYRGAYAVEIAQEIRDDDGERWVDVPAAERELAFRERAYKQVLDHMRHVLEGMGVTFDVWFSERTLHAKGEIEAAIAKLRDAGYVFEAEGAVWFRSTDFGDDKDRVMRKADGEYTYFAADVAYHWDKLQRGFGRIIDIWGADHHGYVKRMEAAVAALGHPGALEVVIGQLVNLYRGGELVRMSKRTGEMVTFEELLDEVGADAARYWFLRRSTDQPVDFDIVLAKEQSAENPVYYVQYAHARICSILRKAAGLETDAAADVRAFVRELVPEATDLAPLGEAAELTLVRKIAEFPEIVEVAARRREPHRLTHYAEDLAATFHQFYTLCRVVDPAEPALTSARLYLVDATRVLLETALGLLGVSAPQRM